MDLSPAPSAETDPLVFYDPVAARVYVSRNHVFDKNVRSYTQQLRSRGCAFDTALVAMEEIQQLRRDRRGAGAAPERPEASEMQRLARELFRKAVQLQASDIHIRVARRSGITRILFRVHNDLEQQEEHPAGWGEQLCSAIYQSMADVSDSTYEPLSRQDARISGSDSLPAGLDGIRIATTPQVDGSVMVLRLLYAGTGSSTDLSALGYSPQQDRQIQSMKRRPTGINIIAGPTGSGKSTTLQRTLLAIHQECGGTKHIITVEDPPEYPIPGIVQTPVANAGTEEERSAAFQAAIKAAMRLDPNVIMIGEMRDGPSARLAVQAAMTGHQVWTTVHANSALAIVDRMVDLGVPLGVMADPHIVTGLVCQRLLKLLCPRCKVRWDPASGLRSAERERLAAVLDFGGACGLGAGCAHCRRGVVGRTVVAEVLVPDAELMAWLRRGDKQQALRLWRERGEPGMLEMAIAKVNAGLCDPFQAEEEVGPLQAGSEAGAGACEPPAPVLALQPLRGPQEPRHAA
jgi:general secretion pathway protein E